MSFPFTTEMMEEIHAHLTKPDDGDKTPYGITPGGIILSEDTKEVRDATDMILLFFGNERVAHPMWSSQLSVETPGYGVVKLIFQDGTEWVTAVFDSLEITRIGQLPSPSTRIFYYLKVTLYSALEQAGRL
jgi:hypothetical protein